MDSPGASAVNRVAVDVAGGVRGRGEVVAGAARCRPVPSEGARDSTAAARAVEVLRVGHAQRGALRGALSRSLDAAAAVAR